MRNIKLTLEYDGTCYGGWQIQKSQKSKVKSQKCSTLQETIEKVLQQILQEKIKLTASGRTDSGVHAKGQVANFKTHSPISLLRLQEGLNALLPGDIAVTAIEEVCSDFHSRFSAQSKIYRYTILNRTHRSALLKNKVYFCRYPLDIALMQKEAQEIFGEHNFKAFQASTKKVKNLIRIIKNVNISKDQELIHIDIEANSFLYNMVRNIVGTLIEIGRGRFPPGSLKKILLSKDRKLAGPTAPACGLCLMEVKY